MPEPSAENPFESPREISGAEDLLPASKWTRRGVLILGIISTPIAALIAGYGCCTASLIGADDLLYRDSGRLAAGLFLFFPGGALAATVGLIFAFRRWYRRAIPGPHPGRE